MFSKISSQYIPFLEKVIQRVVAAQTHSHFEKKILMPSMQSFYRKHHSTEAALLRVMNHVPKTIDLRQDVVVVKLDLSAAFDNLDHNLGFSRTMLKRFSSYLTGRTQSAFIVNTTSSKSDVRIWSSARVDSWTSLVQPIYGTCSRHNLCSMFYAVDHDSQRYTLLLILLIDVMPWTPFSWAQFFEGWLALTRS